jgi:cobalt/nickel transport system permease protein
VGTIAVRAAAGAATLALVAATTPPSSLAAALRALRLPAALVEVLALTQRYVSVLGAAARTSWEAQTLRLGYCGWGQSVRSGGELVGLALLRALAQAEATTEAAAARGGGLARLGVPPALSRRDGRTAAALGTIWIALAALSFGGGR